MLHNVPAERAAVIFRDVHGLTATEVGECRNRFGSNDIVLAPPSGWRNVLRDTVRDPMVWFLAATALLFAWLGDYAEAAILGIALAPIIGMDAYLHRRTQASTEGLAGRLAAQARVLRDGVLTDIPSTEIVPGDIVIVSEPEPWIVRSLGPQQAIPHARSMAMVTLIVASATITMGLSRLRTRGAAIAVVASLASAVVFAQFGPIAELLHLSPLHTDDWLLAAAAGLVPGALASLIAWRHRGGDHDRTRQITPDPGTASKLKR